ncbi:MAG: thioredoxin domain-containing protein [Candidatus Aenigmarchaeota archaeon]|nr:thioredoxin domain-containing protein [Candidatus Aenigmarchaeota archaeon]
MKITINIPKINPWIIVSLVLAIALVVLLHQQRLQITGATVLPGEEVGKKAIDYINSNLVQVGQVTLVSVEEMSGVYKVITSYQGQQIPVYITKDGTYLFVSQPLDTSQEIPKEETRQPTGTIGNFLVSEDEICKENGKPIIYFFGSERCPHCRWEHPIIEDVAGKFEGYISFHNNMDSDADREIFSKYSTGAIPTLVFGCKYYRVGSGESIGKEQETKVLTALICKLTENKPSDICDKVKDLI